MTVPNRSKRASRLLLLAASAALAAGAAEAQSLSTNSAEFNAGWGRTPGSENHMVDYITRDANGNRVIIDGLILAGEDQSVYSRAGGFGVASSYAGVGAIGGASAIGNNLTVITQGNNNTVIIDSTQINNGDVIANSNTSGGVNDGD